MTPLGKPLVFYLKYMAEMNRLYQDLEEGEERDLTGLDDAERIVEMANMVGDAASNEMADFLESCGNGIEAHFASLENVTVGRKTRRAKVLTNWFWRTDVRVPSVGDGWFCCGVSLTAPPEIRLALQKDECGIVMVWLGSKGGRKGASEVWNILGGSAHSLGDDLGEDKGLVVLACIPVKPQPPDSFHVDRDALISAVNETVARINVVQTKAIVSFGSGLKERDED